MAGEPFNAIFKGLCRAFAALLIAFCPLRAALAQEGGDLQGQILYAYHTQDVNQLREIRQTLNNDVQTGKAVPATRYHLAHADWRLAQSLGAAQREQAQRVLQECVDQLNVLLESDKSSVETLVLQSICYTDLADYKKMQSALLRSRGSDRLSEAQRIAPRNPRVKLAGALVILARARSRDAIPRELIEAAESFEHSAATNNDSPGWGHAEAYLRYGHELRVRGDVLDARNWIEKALIAAPDYKAAAAELALLGR